MGSRGGTGFITEKNRLSLSQETPARGILSEPLRLEGLVGGLRGWLATIGFIV